MENQENPNEGVQPSFEATTRYQHLLNKNRPVYNGKRVRKSVTRKAVDFSASELLLQKKRICQQDVREKDTPRIFIPDDSYADLLPPKAWKDNYMTSVCAKFEHTSVNKLKFPVNCAAWTPDGRRLITASTSGEFTLWNGMYFNFETILKAHDDAVRFVDIFCKSGYSKYSQILIFFG